ncbi:MAG: hypothetical protein V1928_04245 [Parcubacteria group bacterium]
MKIKNLYLPLLILALFILFIPKTTQAAGFYDEACNATVPNPTSQCVSQVCDPDGRCTSPEHQVGGDCKVTRDCAIPLACQNGFCADVSGVGTNEMGTPCTQITANQCKSGICDAATSKCTDASGNVATARTVMKLPNFLGITQVSDVIGRVIQTIIGLVGSFALIIFIYGGGLWLISAGRK